MLSTFQSESLAYANVPLSPNHVRISQHQLLYVMLQRDYAQGLGFPQSMTLQYCYRPSKQTIISSCDSITSRDWDSMAHSGNGKTSKSGGCFFSPPQLPNGLLLVKLAWSWLCQCRVMFHINAPRLRPQCNETHSRACITTNVASCNTNATSYERETALSAMLSQTSSWLLVLTPKSKTDQESKSTFRETHPVKPQGSEAQCARLQSLYINKASARARQCFASDDCTKQAFCLTKQVVSAKT